MKNLLLLAIILTTFVVLPDSQVLAMNGWGDGRYPYGDYCPGYKKKWYGAKISVKTAEEAKKMLQEYFSKDKVKIGLVTEEKWFFRAEIVDENDTLLDIVIIDKRTGRIRSIY